MSDKRPISGKVTVFNWLFNLVKGKHSKKVSPKKQYLYGNLKNERKLVGWNGGGEERAFHAKRTCANVLW